MCVCVCVSSGGRWDLQVLSTDPLYTSQGGENMSQEKNNVDLITDVAQERAIIPSGEEAIDIREEALGTNLPANYYWSWQFLGTVVVRNTMLGSRILTSYID